MTAGVAAGGAQIAYYYIAETTYGVTPASAPAFLPLRLTNFGLSLKANTISTDELRHDRHRATARRGQTTVEGDLTAELSFGSHDDLIAAAMCSTWATDVIQTGTTRTSFSILKRNLDIGLDTIYTGCEVSQLKLACPLQEKVTATFSIIGADEQEYTAPSGTTFGTPSTTDFMATFDGGFTIGGTAFHAGTDLNLTINNNMNAKYSLFQRNAYTIKLGMADITGDLSAYVEDDTLKGYFRSETDEALAVTLTDKSSLGNEYVITIPRGRFLTGEDTLNGDDLVIQKLDWRALLDNVSGTELKIQRIAA